MASAQTELPQARIVNLSVDPEQVVVLHVRPGYVSSVRVLEEVSSVVLACRDNSDGGDTIASNLSHGISRFRQTDCYQIRKVGHDSRRREQDGAVGQRRRAGGGSVGSRGDVSVIGQLPAGGRGNIARYRANTATEYFLLPAIGVSPFVVCH